MYVHMCRSECVCVCLGALDNECTLMHGICICRFVVVRLSMFAYVYVCMCVCMGMCVSVCVYVCERASMRLGV